jgi:hypothetical protein
VQDLEVLILPNVGMGIEDEHVSRLLIFFLILEKITGY